MTDLSNATGPIRRLTSDTLAAEIWPTHGARIASLFDAVRGHEWMDRPPVERGIPTNRVGDDFGDSPLVGADECFPTVGPATIDGIEIPDHGEVWPRAWDEVQGDSPDAYTLRCDLERLPLTIERTARVTGSRLRLAYRIVNRGNAPTPFLWCWHPLFVMPKAPNLTLHGVGDVMRIQSSIGMTGEQESRLVAGGPRGVLSRLDLGAVGPSAVKAFLPADRDGRAVLTDAARDTSLTVGWSGQPITGLGIWINHGGWAGYSHVAIEPTTMPLESIAEVGQDRWLEPGQAEEWTLEIGVGAADEPA